MRCNPCLTLALLAGLALAGCGGAAPDADRAAERSTFVTELVDPVSHPPPDGGSVPYDMPDPFTARP